MDKTPSERSSGLAARYAVPAAPVEVEERIRRSRFVTRLGRVASRAEALAFVQETRDRHPGATHYCWAFNAGPPSSTALVGMSDDGEPHGTAGRPMLTALLHSDVGEVVAVCARFYGGTKLGAGGLARAYASGVKRALDACERVAEVDAVAVSVVVPYDAAARAERVFGALEGIVAARDYAATVRYRVLIPRDRRSQLATEVANATAGRGIVTPDAG